MGSPGEVGTHMVALVARSLAMAQLVNLIADMFLCL